MRRASIIALIVAASLIGLHHAIPALDTHAHGAASPSEALAGVVMTCLAVGVAVITLDRKSVV
jgi:hypothetical protein